MSVDLMTDLFSGDQVIKKEPVDTYYSEDYQRRLNSYLITKIFRVFIDIIMAPYYFGHTLVGMLANPATFKKYFFWNWDNMKKVTSLIERKNKNSFKLRIL